MSEVQQLASKAEHCVSKYKGVRYRSDRKEGKKWGARIFKDHKHHFLGYYSTEVEAALAYNDAAKGLYGEDAFLNDVKQPTA